MSDLAFEHRFAKKAGIGGAVIFLIFAGCVQMTTWVTPAGTAIAAKECRAYVPADGKSPGQICLSRVIRETQEEIAQCEREGGSAGHSSMLDAAYSAATLPSMWGRPVRSDPNV